MQTAKKPLRLGMVGGGPGSGIGPAHRHGAAADGEYVLVAGSFSRSADKNAQMGVALNLDQSRVYADFTTMASAEAVRPDGVDAVSIVTPNDAHAPACLAFIEQGIHVLCDKPLATSYADAVAIYRAARESNVLVGLTHTYASYSMVNEARARVDSGELGKVRLVQMEYSSGSRTELVERTDEKTRWRMTPSIAGPSSVIGDLGTHAHHLARFITGLEVVEVSADIQTFVSGRTGDDNAEINLRFTEGARGHLWTSVIAAGLGNGLRVRIFGERGSLEWSQEQPDELWLRILGQPHRMLRRGEPGLSAAAERTRRTKLGHPQGYLDSFANYYRDAASVIRELQQGQNVGETDDIATARDGVLGMRFVEACVTSHANNGAWTNAAVDWQNPSPS